MKAVAAVVAALALVAPASAQQPIKIQKPAERTSATVTNMDPGDGTEVDLATLAGDIGLYDKKLVRTRGTLELVTVPSSAIKEFFVLRSGNSNAQLLLIPSYGLHHDDLMQLRGSELQVRGIVRMLGNRMFRDDALNLDTTNPDLPPLPGASPELPRVSLTALSLSRSRAPRDEMSGQNFAKLVLAEPARFAGKAIRILGQFRGSNLFGDLPEDTRRKPGDWVLLDGEQALWVLERPPKGKGFTLDAAYKGDTSRWLEVEGKPEVVNGVLYLRASKVILAVRRTNER